MDTIVTLIVVLVPVAGVLLLLRSKNPSIQRCKPKALGPCPQLSRRSKRFRRHLPEPCFPLRSNVRFAGWFQWVDAALARGLFRGVSKVKPALGRRFKENPVLLRSN